MRNILISIAIGFAFLQSCDLNFKREIVISSDEICVRFDSKLLEMSVLNKGRHIVNADDYCYFYSKSDTLFKDCLVVESKSGRNFTFSTEYRSQINLDTILALHREFGPNFFDSHVKAEIRSAIRHVSINYDIEQINTDSLSEYILEEMKNKELYSRLIDSKSFRITNN